MGKSAEKKRFLLLVVCAGFFLILPVQKQALAVCTCRGDTDYNGMINLYDAQWMVNMLRFFGPPYVVDANELPCADLADPNGMGVDGGDGQVDIGDLNFMGAYLSYLDPPWMTPVCAPLDLDPCPTDPCITIDVNGVLWDGESAASAGDIITVTWVENRWGWIIGFCNFNLNVSRGQYMGDFNSPVDWTLIDFSTGPDGQGGFNIGGGCSSFTDVNGTIFSFNFRVPLEVGAAYTIHIHPTQGSWRRVMHDQLPSVDLPVDEAVCADSPQYDLNNDCKIDFKDYALLSSEWLYCGIQ